MWRYLVLNGLWFSILFLVHFFGNTISRRFVLGLVLAAAVFAACQTAVDPFAWTFYLVFSLLVFWGSRQFRLWAFAGSFALDEELGVLNRRLNVERASLGQRSSETGVVARHADEIAFICEKIKEMSRSLDPFETFLVFGEALARHFKFEEVKLVTLAEDVPEGAVWKAGTVQALRYADFQGLFDRAAFLKGRLKTGGEFTEFDRRVIDAVVRDPRPINAVGRRAADPAERWEPLGGVLPFLACPLVLQKRVFAVLILLGVDQKDVQIFSVLMESFMAELQRVKLYERVQTLAVTDGLTAVSVRRHLLQRLEDELDRSRRLGLKLSFLMIDIDDFKYFNDQYGHLVGDVVLREVADTIRRSIREVDLVGRYGGEEFGVFLIETDESGAFFVAERIRRAVADRSYRAYDENLKVTVSIGCSTFSRAHQDASQIVDSADIALYQAKRQGKNRVHLASMEV